MIYLDNASAALPDKETAAFFAEALQKYGANQESAHKEGYLLRKEISDAGRTLSEVLTGSPDRRVIWCSSATEAFHIFSHCCGCEEKKILTSKMEHPALSAALRRISADIRYLSPDRKTGQLSLEDACSCNIAAFHLIQSETGIIQDAEKLFASTPGAIHFLDAVQGACKMKIPRKNADIIAVSGNKFGAPGCGALLLSPDFPETDKFLDKAEKMRHKEYLIGRVPPAAILTCTFAAKRAAAQMQQHQSRIAGLNSLLRRECAELGFIPTIQEEYSSSCILHLLAPGFQGGVLVRMLSEEGVLLSSGSACASETREPSPALTALGYSKKEAYSGLRISLDFSTDENDVKILLSSLEKVLKKY
jgi:cysteine desulfurase